MAIGKDFIEFQDKIGYTFTNLELMQTAFTHSSYSNEQRSRGNNFESNERLEFLGDAVLQVVVSKHLFTVYRSHNEGLLTKMRQYLVCEKTLSKIAADLKIGEYINLGKGEELTDCRNRPKVLADTLESIFGAIYIDSSYDVEKTGEVILSLLSEEIDKSSVMQKGDYKTLLQQLVEKEGSATLEYTVISESGPEHKKSFTVAALINNNTVGTGVSGSKKGAEMQAAREALRLFGIDV